MIILEGITIAPDPIKRNPSEDSLMLGGCGYKMSYDTNKGKIILRKIGINPRGYAINGITIKRGIVYQF